MNFKIHRHLIYNTIKQSGENSANIYKKQYFQNLHNASLNLPFLTINSTETCDTEKAVENLKKQIFQNKVNINKKKKELQVLKIQYNKLIKENRAYKKMIYEVLDLHDEAKSTIERKDNKENFLESSYISEEQLINKINSCKIDIIQEKQLQNSFEMLNLKEELYSKRKVLLNKRKEYSELKKGISLKNMNEMSLKLETICDNERKLKSDVTSLEERLAKNVDIISQIQNEIKSEEKINEELNKQESEYESLYNKKMNEMKEIEKDISNIDTRRKNKITKITNNPKYEGIKLKGIRLKSKIFKIKNDIDVIEKYENENRGDLIKILEQRRAIVSELKNKNKELENQINELEKKNTKLYVQVNLNSREKSALENRGKEQIKDIKRMKDLEKITYELNLAKNKIIKELEEKQKIVDNLKKENKNIKDKEIKKDNININQVEKNNSNSN